MKQRSTLTVMGWGFAAMKLAHDSGSNPANQQLYCEFYRKKSDSIVYFTEELCENG